MFSVAVCAAILLPIGQNWAEDPRDGFPLSYYPMFTDERNGTTKLYHLVAIDEAGVRHPVPYRTIGTGGFNQVRRQTRRLMRDDGAEALCREVAERITEENRPATDDWIEVRAVVAHYDFDRFFAGDLNPREEEVWGSCPIGGPR